MVIGIPLQVPPRINYSVLREAPAVLPTDPRKKRKKKLVDSEYLEILNIRDRYLTDGLTKMESESMWRCTEELYKKYQYEIVSMSINRLLKERTDLIQSGYFPNETEKSLTLLKGKFKITKIRAAEKKKVGCWYQVIFSFISDTITFDNSIYHLRAKVLMREHHHQVEFHVTQAEFDIERRKEKK